MTRAGSPATARSAKLGAAFLWAALLANPTQTAAQGEAACARDVLVAKSMQRQALDDLEGASDDEAVRCRVWRRHAETMRRVAAVYGRCLSGGERTERLAQVQGSEREFAGLVRSRCQGR